MKIAILITCIDKSDFARRHPDDGEKFRVLLSAVRPDWEYVPFRVSDLEFPEVLDDFDGYVVCGSCASANDDLEWVLRLLDMIREADAASLPVFGCCFGHQAVAKALGGKVARNGFGWSAGIETTDFNRREDWMPDGLGSLEVYSFHQEQVTELPAGCRIVGTNRRTPVASFARGDHIFTSQYHPEITQPFIADLVEDMADALGHGADESRRHAAKEAQGPEFAELIALFFEHASVSRTTGRRQTPDPVSERHLAAKDMARMAGEMALRYFGELSKLHIERKGPGDLVSEADRNVEELVRSEIKRRFPDDGIIGEEFANKEADSAFTWVIDPIDGTANYVRGIPAWCVSIACVRDAATVVGVIFDPVHDEMHHCRRNRGTWLNEAPQRVVQSPVLTDFTAGIGFSSKFRKATTLAMLEGLLENRLVFARSGSGALGLAHVACGRYNCFLEEHQNAWDCMAGLLLVEEAGGIVQDHCAETLLKQGGKVVVSGPFAFEAIRSIADKAFR